MTRATQEISPKLWRIPVPLPSLPGAEHLGFVNCYLVGGTDRWALVDTGMTTDEGLHALEEGLKTAGLVWPDVRLVLITHHHPDHYGTSRKIRELSGAEVMIHRRDVETLFGSVWSGHNAGDFIAAHGGPRIEIPVAMFVQMPGFEPAAPDHYLTDEQLIDLGGRDLLVLFTPGHAPGHCCFVLREEGTILTGDHVLPKITPHVGYFPGGPDNPLADYIDSLKRVGEGSYRLGLPAHGEPFLDPASRVARIVRHHEFRLLAVADALGHDRKTAWEIIPTVFGNLPEVHYFPALFETLAHLVHDEALGKVQREESNGRVLWHRTN